MIAAGLLVFLLARHIEKPADYQLNS
jgi:hypothetical protein